METNNKTVMPRVFSVDAVFFIQRRHELFFSSILLAGVCSMLLFSPLIRAQTPEELKMQFFNEAQQKWREYCLYAGRLQGEVTRLDKRGEKIARSLRWTVKQNTNCRLLLDQSEKGTTRGALSAYNSMYFFSLQRLTVDSPWTLTNITRREERQEEPAEIKRVNQRLCIASYLIRLFAEDLPDVVGMPSFRVLRVAPITRNGMELAQIEFDNTHPVEVTAGQQYCPVQGGTMLLDPNRCWCLRACDILNKYSNDDARVRIETELRDTQSKYPIPKRWMATQESSGDRIITMVMDFNLEEPLRLPSDDEFTLTAFGLSEPFSMSRKPILWYRWAAMAGFAFFLGAFLFRWLARRAKIHSAP